ncbi:ClpP/crotonase-like domain-containing protein [Aspergillus candidus]|uniref:ClpP/crotonase-like domain-containing protein n=1 Tax=Aspergillus candidus TaxID=41067 RepID=A0A2I2FKZ1_ASPCN|nr:ClpP/crotonase-like domain-containing protein [Aspergillus candidus]PLB41307.1 ClpP/crotonase-like domain-containing protein [Aspergillus candidus]
MATTPQYKYKYWTVQFPREHVAHVEINRPDKLNAFIQQMWLEMRQLFDQLSVDPRVRAIVLTGAGDRAFTAGLDVKAASTEIFGDKGGADTARKAIILRRYVLAFQDCLTAIERCEKTVICAMHGFAYGFAIDISSATDIRICTQDVQFAVKEVDIGMAADIGVLSRLPKIVGSYGWVKEVAISARIFGADEALRVGFVNAIHSSKAAAVQAALDLAGLIAQKSPVAVLGTKELLNYSRDHSINDGLRYTAVWNSGAIQTDDVPAALTSSMEKRVPTFEKL